MSIFVNLLCPPKWAITEDMVNALTTLATTEARSKYVQDALKLLGSSEGPLGKATYRRGLYKKVGSYKNVLELTENVRTVIHEYIFQKIPGLKDLAGQFSGMSDKDITDKIVGNWLEEINKTSLSDEKQKILAAVIAHVINRLTNDIYIKTLDQASPQNLELLGLDKKLCTLLVNLLKAGIKADPLFIKFLSYSQKSAVPPEGASTVALYGSDRKWHTIASLFPRETKILVRYFTNIIKDSSAWVETTGGKVFQEYLTVLRDLYAELDIQKAKELHEKVKQLYEALALSEFPIIITPALEGFYKPPYLDPELRVSIAPPDAKAQEKKFKPLQQALAKSLGTLGVEKFTDLILNRNIRVVVSLGSYGVCLTFGNAVAQEQPPILLFLNEQIWTYDRAFPKFLKLITNTEKEFDDTHNKTLEEMSRIDTMMHELSHYVYIDGCPESERLGTEPVVTIDEVKAEIIYRALIPDIIKKDGLVGSKKQWAIASLAMPLQVLKSSEDDEYFKAAIYATNELLIQKIVTFDGQQLTINDYSEYFKILKLNAEKVIKLYEDEKMTKDRAAKWILDNCTAGAELQKVLDFLRKESD